ncbi:MAG TPA: AI-2E family transporter [Gemmatimonadaceae bacterium]|nr:AI-2E family transporter [Gemmatimonadaceae bacterium]
MAERLAGSDVPQIRGAAVTVLAVLACAYSIYFARGFLLPIAFALLLSFLLSPVVRALGMIHIPTPAAAALIVVSAVAVVAVCGYGLAGPVEGMIAHAPQTLRKAGVRLRVVARPVDQVEQAAEQVERATAVGESPRAQQVIVRGPTLASRFFGSTQAFIEGAIEVILLLFFLLATGDLFLEKLIKVLPLARDQQTAVRVARAIETSISTYLLTTAVINISEGVIVALAMWGLGMPTPIVWGAMVAALEFVPYIGMTIAVAVFTVAGLTTFASLPHALAAPAVFFVINFFVGNVVSPLIMSKRLTLNPVAMFIGLIFWWWVWGAAGALLGVPLLAAFKILCDHIESLASVGEFLGGRDPVGRRTWVRGRVTRASVEPGPAPLT